jgi:hypothetical protein
MNYSALIDALIIVESGGRADAVGDNGKAFGILQIWSVVVQDVNKVFGTNFRHQDAFNPTKAKQICRRYLSIYAIKSRIGDMDPYEASARIWNGGPNGHRKNATLGYWAKVKRQLKLSPTK